MPFEVSTGYSKGKTGVKKTRSAVADEFAESTAFYKDLDAAQRKVFFGTEKLETGPIGEIFRQRLEEAGITRFTNEDGTVDYEAAIREFKRQWTDYERGGEILKERSDYDEARAKAYVEEMERVEAAEREAMDQISAEEAAARDEAAKSGMMFSRADDLAFVETPKAATSYKEARDILRRETGKRFTNVKSGLSASLSGNSINKILSGKAVAKSVGIKQHLAAAANIVELFEGGELRATEEGNRKGVKAAKRVFARFDLEGEKLVAKITVLEHERNDHRIYSVEAMEVAKAGSILAPKDSMSQAENPALPSTEGIITNSSEGAQGGRKLLFSIGKAPNGKPSALGDGKERYYEVPFDKAVDRIVKNRKPIGNEHVFISETPGVFRDIGLPSLPVMMNQSHVLSCYFGQGEGVKAGNMHGLGAKLKSLPKAIAKPMMVIANDSNPSSSVIAIVKMQDRDGHTVIAPVEINGIGQSTDGRVTANIVKSAFGKKNIWSEKVAKALRDEVDGKISVFYIDSNEARQIENRLAREAFHFGGTERQLLRSAKGTVHSVSDFGSPVKGVGAQTDSHQFKRWFGGSKVVDASGEPLVVWHGTDGNFTEFKQEEMREREGSFFFAENREDAKAYSGSGKVMPVYVNLRKPFDYENGIVPEAYKGRWRNAKDKREQVAILKELGYDGWLANFENGKGWGEISAFYPNQIKSATDNIGTFDPGNNDIRFSRGTAPEAEYVRLTRVADDAGAGERTPGAMAASAELSRTTPTPLTTKGTRYVALPVSEMAALARYLKIGHAQLLRQDMPGGVSLKHKKLWIAADVLGTVDKTDMAAEKEILKRHGFFQQEDPGWLAAHSPTDARRERFRSEDALAAKLEALADRRIAGKEPGGFAAGRKVFADQLAKVVMSMPHGQPGVLGAMQTVGGALEKRVRGDEAEADAFIGWMKGEATPPARSAQERKAEMFAAFLMMPQQNLSSAESSPAAELTMRSRA